MNEKWKYKTLDKITLQEWIDVSGSIVDLECLSSRLDENVYEELKSTLNDILSILLEK